MSSTVVHAPKSKIGQPVWEIAELFPPQGLWSEDEYLALETNRLIEFDNGVLEILPMPNTLHQVIALVFANLLLAFENGKLGTALCAPLRLKLPNGKYREPDVLFLLHENDDKLGLDYWTGADLVVEIVSPGGHERDYIEKRSDYARTGIREYWIVDPLTQKVIVFKLDGKKYVEHGVFKKGSRATSALLIGFKVDVAALFAAGPKLPGK